MECAKEHGRLLSIKTCSEFEGLGEDLWQVVPYVTEKYWFGFYAGGFDQYKANQRVNLQSTVSLDARGEQSLYAKSSDACGNLDLYYDGSAITAIPPVPNDGFYGQLVYNPDTNDPSLNIIKYEKSDPDVKSSYLCEKENQWTCPETVSYTHLTLPTNREV